MNGRGLDGWSNVTEFPTFLVNSRSKRQSQAATDLRFIDLEKRIQQLIQTFLNFQTQEEELNYNNFRASTPTAGFPHKLWIIEVFQEGLKQFILAKTSCFVDKSYNKDITGSKDMLDNQHMLGSKDLLGSKDMLDSKAMLISKDKLDKDHQDKLIISGSKDKFGSENNLN